MRTITFASAKGGVGKSTLSVSVAVAAQEAGERVYLVDCDPQRSVLAWGERRTADAPGIDEARPHALEGALAGLERAGYTLAIVDTQGSDSAGSAIAMRLADLVAVPVRPFAIDVLAVVPTRDAIATLGKPYAIILNAAMPRVSARVADAMEAFDGKVAPVVVNRFAHCDSFARGLGVTEIDPHGPAAAEIRELWAFLKEKIR